MLKFTLLCVSIVFVCYSGVQSEDSELKVSPTTFEDLGKPFYEFTCEAYLKKYQWVSWYQEKPVGTKPIFLKTLITPDEGQIKIDLLIPLDESDRDSVIYCITHNENKENGVKTFTKISKSEDIHIKFQKDKYPLKKLETPQVTPAIFNDGGEPVVEFTCWGYLQGGLQKPRLSWYQVKGNNKVLFNKTDLQTYYGYEKVLFRKTLEPSDIGSHLYCVHETRNGYYVEGVRSKEIPFTISRDPTDFWGPRIDPVTFSEVGNSLTVNNNCSAYLYERELLTWFKIKGSNTPKRLTMIQQKEKYGKLEIKLQKTLDLSYKDTEIYCARETVDEKMSFNIEGESRRIRIEFQNHLEGLETPRVTIEPSSDVIIFDDKQKLELVCGGSEPVDDRKYTWYLQGSDHQSHPFSYNFKKSTNQILRNHLKHTMEKSYHMNKLYCAQDYTFNFKVPTYEYSTHYRNDFTLSYGEFARSNTITLLLRTQGDLQEKPEVTPSYLEDQRKSFVVFTCYAFMLPWEVLSWYQYKGPYVTEKILLRTVQLQDITHKNGQWLILTLNKTLQPSDKDSNIYCAKQTVLLGGNYSKESDKMTSQTITLTFQRDISPFNAYVTTRLEPDSDVHFEVNTTKRFTCSGSERVDGRNYTWFRIDRNFNLTIPENQSYDSSTNTNILEVSFNDTFHQNQLFCEQVYLSDIKDKNGTIHLKYYGGIVKSNIITLKRGGKDAEKVTSFVSSDRSQKTILLAIIIPVLLALVAGLAYWNLRRRRLTAVHDVPTATPTPTGTPEPKSAKHRAIAARQYPSEPNGDTMTPTETSKTPKPDVRPKPAPRPDLTLLESTKPSKSEIPLRPTPAAKPAIAARPNLFVSTPNTLAPTETPSPIETPMPTVTPEQPTSVLKEQGDNDAIYGNFVKLFTDMDSNQVTYACLDLQRNKSTAPNVRTQKPPKANIRGAPKTSASTDVSRTNASAMTTLATSESSPYAQIIGVYTPPNK